MSTYFEQGAKKNLILIWPSFDFEFSLIKTEGESTGDKKLWLFTLGTDARERLGQVPDLVWPGGSGGPEDRPGGLGRRIWPKLESGLCSLQHQVLFLMSIPHVCQFFYL